MTALALQQPEIAAAIALLLLIAGTALVIFVWKRIRRAVRSRPASATDATRRSAAVRPTGRPDAGRPVVGLRTD